MFFGGDYSPEQWPESVWREDMRLMREAGVNLVSIGIFSWAKLQPSPRRYTFDWFDRLMDLLAENGIFADIATATASPPPWMAKLYPDSLPVGRDGLPYHPGSRQHYSPCSPSYRRLALALVERLASRYGGHPALAMWHINNEYACHTQECHGEHATRAFRAWLQARYETLEALNAAWGTAFWSQQYGAWDEIRTPLRAPTLTNPTQELDYRRFMNDAFLDLCRAEREILARITPDLPATTNFVWPFKPLDYRKWAPEMDFISWDAYPDPTPGAGGVEFSAYGHDLFRSLKPRRPFVLMEQTTSQVNWRPVNVLKPPGMMRRLSLQAAARGADGIMFFQWRQSRAGAEKFHGAMVPHVGARPESRVWREVTALGRELARLRPVIGSTVRARVAIAFDWANWWALELPSKPAVIDYAASVGAFHRACFARNLTVDFVAPGAALDGYDLVLAPSLYLIEQAGAANLESFVARGGTLLATYFSGTVDENDQLVTGGSPGCLRDVFGLWVEEWSPYPEGAGGKVRFSRPVRTVRATHWADLVQLDGARALAKFADGFFAGRSAFTINRHGRGYAYYLATRLEDGGLDSVIDTVVQRAGVQPVWNVPAGIEATLREGDDERFLFLINHGTSGATVDLRTTRARDLLGDRPAARRLRLAADDVAVIALPRQDKKA